MRHDGVISKVDRTIDKVGVSEMATNSKFACWSTVTVASHRKRQRIFSIFSGFKYDTEERRIQRGI